MGRGRGGCQSGLYKTFMEHGPQYRKSDRKSKTNRELRIHYYILEGSSLRGLGPGSPMLGGPSGKSLYQQSYRISVSIFWSYW